ncbi:MAG: hypothetical protein JSS87_12840 [Acidobacteria bacterium]|nr:hypothetical protein [Acidobacteriota bacterium]
MAHHRSGALGCLQRRDDAFSPSRNGVHGLMQFSSSICIDLTRTDWQRVELNAVDRIWLPKKVVLGETVYTNPVDCIVALKFNDQTGDAHPWAIADGYMNTLTGPVKVLFAKVLYKGAGSSLFLATGVGVSASYGSTDGLSPAVGVGGSSSGSWGGFNLPGGWGRPVGGGGGYEQDPNP